MTGEMKRWRTPPWLLGAAALAGGVGALIALASGLSRVLFEGRGGGFSRSLAPALSRSEELQDRRRAHRLPPLPPSVLEAVYWPGQANPPGAASPEATPGTTGERRPHDAGQAPGENRP